MTDQTNPDVTDEDRRLARKWAESMSPDINGSGTALSIARVILDAVPAPTPPTLADMTDEERFNAVGMWADVDGFHPYRAVLGGVPAPKVPVFRPTTGSLDWVRPEDVTPLPELGRAWNPGGSPPQKPAPSPTPALPGDWRLADHYRIGRVIVTNPTPNQGGHVYFVTSDETVPRGSEWGFCTPDELTYLDEEPDHDPQ